MKKDDIICTVFTPTYDQEKYIEKCILGIVNQETNYKYQLLISDDCSSDNTRNIIEKYKKEYPEIIKTIYRKKNLGPMGNFIESLNTVHTKYVALCDGDDYWIDNSKLQREIDFLENNPEYSICFHQTELFYEDGREKNTIHPKGIKNNITLKNILFANPIVANSVMYRWIYQENDSLINDFPKNIVPGDHFLNLMHACVGKIHFIERVMSMYRKHPQSMWYNSNDSEKQLYFYLKNGEKYLRFFRIIEKKLCLEQNVLKAQKNWIIWMELKSFIKYKKYFKLKNLFKNEYKTTPDSFESVYKELSTRDKIFYDLCKGKIHFIIKIIYTAYWRIRNSLFNK